MPLANLIKKVKGSFGIAHKTNLETLRHYLKTTSDDKLEEEIKRLTEGKDLRILWEAGLNSRLQAVVMEVMKKAK